MKISRRLILCVALSTVVLFSPESAVSQMRGVKLPETALPLDVLKTILNEVSGQLAFNNLAVMAAHMPPRAAEEFEGYFFEADYLARKLKEYGLDDVRIESLEKGATPGRTWWAGLEGELWMMKPDRQLLSRLSEDPALVIRGSDTLDCEGEVVYIDERDVRRVKDMDLAGKIILSPEFSGWFREAFQKGALGVVSFYNSIRPLDAPDQVMFDMRLDKGDTKNKVFGFQISQRMGFELRDTVLSGQKVVLRAKTKTADFPFKFETVFAAVKGTSPEKKGLMFTAHLFERPQKIGANDNVSGSVVLAETARTLNALIRQGLIERPERTVYFLWTEEGSGTMAFFRKYPEMAEKIIGAVNMDMVGENLDENSAFFNIETPLYSKSTFLDSAVKDFANFVFVANLPTSDFEPPTPWMPLPFPIIEKNGSLETFRFRMTRFHGGSDHGIFIQSDAGIPALSLDVWPDLWYHTDKDLSDKSDPTQLKRVSFIAAASALAVCSGREEVLEGLIRKTYADRLLFIQETVARSVLDLSRLKSGDKGVAFRNALNNANESVRLSRQALEGIRELAKDKSRPSKFLDAVLSGLGRLAASSSDYLKGTYADMAGLNGYKPDIFKPSPDDLKLERIVPRKIKPVLLGDMFPYTELLNSLRKNPAVLTAVFSKYDYNCLMEMFIAVDGKKSLGQIRNLLSFEFVPVDAADMMGMVKCLEEAKLIETAARPSKRP